MYVHPTIGQGLIDTRESDLQRALRRRRLRRLAASDAAVPAAEVVIRRASPGDDPALGRLAALDGRHRPGGDVLVASVRGAVRAAIGVRDGDLVTDPFTPTDDLAALLRLRAQQLRTAVPGRR